MFKRVEYTFLVWSIINLKAQCHSEGALATEESRRKAAETLRYTQGDIISVLYFRHFLTVNCRKLQEGL